MDLVRTALTQQLRIHPRIAQQAELHIDAQALAHIAEQLPKIVPFGERKIDTAIALLDWDHRLPSKRFTLRLHLCYASASVARFEAALGQRHDEIRQRDLFPEFDVPDYAELPSDETYETEVSETFEVDALHLVSPWRRNVPEELGHQAAQAVRSSPEFAKVCSLEPARPGHLGDLEAVAWTAPCECAYVRWTIDVWWLTAFDGRHGRGWSFLVDVDSKPQPIVAHREFTVRTG